MTFTLRPADEAEGQVLWAKVALVGLAGFVLPIFEPYPYIPVDPLVSFSRLNIEVLLVFNATFRSRSPMPTQSKQLLYFPWSFTSSWTPSLCRPRALSI